MRAAILIAAVIAVTLVAVWAAGAPVTSNDHDCWVLPEYEPRAEDQVITKCLDGGNHGNARRRLTY